MRTVFSYIFTPIYWLYFGSLLVIFHPIQVVSRAIGGYPMRKKAVDVLNAMLIYGLWIMGCRIKYSGLDKVPTSGPFIIISNHQNFFDISPIVWGFRNHHPKFVSKKELGKGIPSISYNLRHGGSALIDRKNRRQSISAILNLGRHVEKEKYCASIFPEGTRSKTGQVKTFKEGGIEALLKTASSSQIVVFCIKGNFELMPQGLFPLTFGTKLEYKVLEVFDPLGFSAHDIALKCEGLIRNEVES